MLRSRHHPLTTVTLRDVKEKEPHDDADESKLFLK